jgi:hypothetical protein
MVFLNMVCLTVDLTRNGVKIRSTNQMMRTLHSTDYRLKKTTGLSRLDLKADYQKIGRKTVKLFC